MKRSYESKNSTLFLHCFKFPKVTSGKPREQNTKKTPTKQKTTNKNHQQNHKNNPTQSPSTNPPKKNTPHQKTQTTENPNPTMLQDWCHGEKWFPFQRSFQTAVTFGTLFCPAERFLATKPPAQPLLHDLWPPWEHNLAAAQLCAPDQAEPIAVILFGTVKFSALNFRWSHVLSWKLQHRFPRYWVNWPWDSLLTHLSHLCVCN